MKHICNKCDKEFKTSQNLEKHINRINPCDLVHKCIRCEKIFNTKSKLIIHLNRKNPCKSVEEILEQQRQRNLIEMRKIELEEKKLKEREKEHLQREKEKEQYYEMEERRLELKEHEHENKLKEIELKIMGKKEVELIKNQRKEMTVHNINNINNGVINNNNFMITENFIKTMSALFPVDGTNTIQSEDFKTHVQNMGDLLRTNDISVETGADIGFEDNLINIFHKCTNVYDMLAHYIKYCFTNKENPKRGIFFEKKLKKYYVYKKRMLTGVEYLEDIQPIIYETIREFICSMQGAVQPVVFLLHDKRKQGKLTNADYVIINKYNEMLVFIKTYETDETLKDKVYMIFMEDMNSNPRMQKLIENDD
jgi:hypothetical protein